MYRITLIILASLISYTFCAQTVADSRMEFRSNPGQQSNIVLIKDNKVRMESESSYGRNISIYNNTSKTFVVLNPSRNSYIEMNQKAIRAQASLAREYQQKMQAEMLQRLQDMPPEQQQQMRQRMRAMGVSPDSDVEPPEVQIKSSGESQQVSGISCEVYEAYADSRKTGEACVAGQDDLNISDEDYRTVSEMFDFMQEMSQQAFSDGKKQGLGENPFNEVEGLPIRMTGEQGNEMQLIKVSHEKIPEDMFRIPAEYQKIEPPAAAQ